MRILMVCPDAPYPPRDGGSLRIVNLARGLSQSASVALLTYTTSGSEVHALQEFGADCGVQIYHVQRPARRNQLTRAWHKLRLYYASYVLSPIPGPVRFNMRPVMCRALAGALAEFKPDAIIWEYWFMAGFAESARQLAPQTLQVLDEIDLEWIRLNRLVHVRRGPHQWWIRFCLARIQSYTLQRYLRMDGVVTLSQTDAEIAQHALPNFDRLRVVPLGLMLEDYPDLGAGQSNQLLFFGSFRHAPNVDALVYLLRELFPRIRDARAGVTLDVMGASLPAHLVEMARSQPGVRVLGFQPDIRPILAESAVIIAPLRFGSGVRVKLLESMALGKAVLTTSIGAEGIEMQPGTDWIVADDAELIVRETIRLLDDEPARQAMGQRARASVHRRHDARIIARDFLQQLEELPSRL